MISQKCQYALRAVFELAKRYREGPVRTADIAKAQEIPQKFLEAILNQLKQGGFVMSQRGNEGGYMLIRLPEMLTVGEVMRFVEGPLGPVECIVQDRDKDCPLSENCVFMGMWEKVRKAVSDVYDNTTFRDLVEEEREMQGKYVPRYQI